MTSKQDNAVLFLAVMLCLAGFTMHLMNTKIHELEAQCQQESAR